MSDAEPDPQEILASCSPAFRDLHGRIGAAVRKRFPKARLQTSFGMAAWVAPVQDPPQAEEWKGTMPRDVFTVGPTEKKAGITVHVWHPHHPDLLKQNEAMLKEAGFKVMVGCLQWNRKAPFPITALEDLLTAAKDAS